MNPMPQRRYDLLAVDLDGTLFGPDGKVSEGNRQAIDRARAQGLEVVICTGRSMRESITAINAIRADIPAAGRTVAPMVCAGGAMLCDVATGATLHRWPMHSDLVARLCRHFADRERAPLILKDYGAAGFDYLIVNSGPIEAPTQWWFSAMNVEVKFVDHIDHDPHPEHTVRVGFAAMATIMRDLARTVHDEFGQETLTQHFAAVAGFKKGEPHGVRDESVHLLEVFDRQVNKWTAVHRLALVEDDILDGAVAEHGDRTGEAARGLVDGGHLRLFQAHIPEEYLVVEDVLRAPLGDDRPGLDHADAIAEPGG